MIRIFRAWLARRRAKQQAREFYAGYKRATLMLTTWQDHPSDLADVIKDIEVVHSSCDFFDKGAFMALADWKKKTGWK